MVFMNIWNVDSRQRQTYHIWVEFCYSNKISHVLVSIMLLANDLLDEKHYVIRKITEFKCWELGFTDGIIWRTTRVRTKFFLVFLLYTYYLYRSVASNNIRL